MGYKAIRDDVKAALEAISLTYTADDGSTRTLTIANVRKKYKRETDKLRFANKYREGRGTDGIVNVAFIERVGLSETDDDYCGKTDLTWNYQIHFFYGFIEKGKRDSGDEFNDLIDGIIAKFCDESWTESSIIKWGKPNAPDAIAYNELGGVFCHYAVITIPIVERITT